MAESLATTEPRDFVDSNARVELAAPIGKLERWLAKALKPTRRTISAVKVKDGRFEEVHGGALPPFDPLPEKGVTVAQPEKGCPVKVFDIAETRATRVLLALLDEQQVADFRKRQAILVRGADSGHSYVVASRSSREYERRGRSVYDLDERRAVCVHDFLVPAAEEMLELAVLLQVPGREDWVRTLPAVGIRA